MGIFLGLVMLARIGALLARRHLGKAATPIMGGLGGLAVLLVLLNTLPSSSGEAASTNREVALETACGYMIGQQIAKDLPQGGSVLLIQHVPEFLGESVSKAQRAGLMDGLGEGPWSVDAASVNVVDMAQETAGLSAFDDMRFSRLLGDHPEAVAVVSLIGFPQCRPNQVSEPIPHMYVLADWGGDVAASWVRNQSLKTVVAPRAGAGRPGKMNLDGEPAELFDQRYTMKSK